MCLKAKKFSSWGFAFLAMAFDQPIQSNVNVNSTIPAATTGKELMNFLGMANYYLKFLLHYATLMASLRHLLKKDTT